VFRGGRNAGERVRLIGDDRAEIEVLIAAALKLAELRLNAGATGSMIIRAEEQKQRARRASKAARPASARRTAKARR
jgi:hypothetical protein